MNFRSILIAQFVNLFLCEHVFLQTENTIWCKYTLSKTLLDDQKVKIDFHELKTHDESEYSALSSFVFIKQDHHLLNETSFCIEEEVKLFNRNHKLTFTCTEVINKVGSLWVIFS